MGGRGVWGALFLLLPSFAAPFDFDVLIYGTTPAGVLAAAAAAGEGARVALLDPRAVVGGAIAGGLCETDIGTTTATIGGRAREFFERIGAHYNKKSALYAFEPHVAEAVFREFLAPKEITLALNARISGLRAAGGVITSAVLANGSALTARVFVDASYEGW